MPMVASIHTEKENFMDIGCYLYRISPIIMEIHTTENYNYAIEEKRTTETRIATEVLASLSTNVEHAKELVRKCSNGTTAIMGKGLEIIIEQLEETIHNIGNNLSSMPSFTFQNNYAETVVTSLSKEMKNACFQSTHAQPYEVVAPAHVNQPTDMIGEIEGKSPTPPSRRNSKSRRSNSNKSDTPRLVDFLKGMHYSSEESETQSFTTLTSLAEYIEPLYETFFCPLTKRIMEDPVTIETGVTYERSAITEWFEKHNDDYEGVHCPTTGMRLQSKNLSTNLALKTTIKEWRERNEARRLRVAQTALSLAISEAMVLDAVGDLQVLCQTPHNREQMHNIGITKLLTKFLKHKDRKVRCKTLAILHTLAEDDHGKEIIANTKAIAATVKMLSSKNSSERHSSVSFLLELSKSKFLCEHIGMAAGSIFMLIRMKYNKNDDSSIAEEAGEILKNLEKFPKNIKYMAENGLLQPLLNQLIEGSWDTQMEMTDYLNELILEHDVQTYVTLEMSKGLLEIVHCSNSFLRKSVFKALVHISIHEQNIGTLLDAGIIPTIIEEMFTSKIHNEPTDVKEESASILANVLHSTEDPESIEINKHGDTMTSDYFICNLIRMLSYSIPSGMNVNLIKVLSYLSKQQHPFSRIASVLKETGTIQTVIEFLNSQHDDLIMVSAELLIKLSSHIGHTISERLCKTQEQPEGLVGRLESNNICVIKKNALALNLLAKLPHQNLTLNLALLQKDIVPIILQRISKIQKGETMTSSWTRSYLEGLVGTLLRFTSSLYDIDVLSMARQQNLTSVFTGLLIRNAGSEEVQRLAALGLENVSSESINLSMKPNEMIKQRKGKSFLCICFGMRQKGSQIRVCPIHRGECSSSRTFCLLEAGAIQGLVSCLESENGGVVEAALGAISTLLDERVDVERSVEILTEMDAVRRVLGVLGRHKEGGVWDKTLWVIDRVLVGRAERSANDISEDRILSRALISAFYQGNGRTSPVAERIMRQLNMLQASGEL
ncbi:Putative U-box domain-containing protein 42 [Apostasia shenzhenica]|uniref:RING-type E3 ubiquitin transferase n=1 Tax=Apostasia shenzhenica TaxID=1088818 RepID=A0A2H9ZSQ1_9ASPA|nr:Putative U-box domain-containing protein 42 [Apostasia shenzhenica]